MTDSAYGGMVIVVAILVFALSFGYQQGEIQEQQDIYRTDILEKVKGNKEYTAMFLEADKDGDLSESEYKAIMGLP